jgi:hypothetical protein
MSDTTQGNAMLDFNTAGEQRDVIPANTVVTVQLKINPGGANPSQGNWFKRYQSGSEGLECEYTILDGPYAKRKFFENLVMLGPTEGQMKMADSNRAKIRAMLESAYGIKPDDNSAPAQEARRPKSYAELNGLCFMARLGVEPPQGTFSAKNKIDLVITPEQKNWQKPQQRPKPASSENAPAAAADIPAGAVARPKWGSGGGQ